MPHEDGSGGLSDSALSDLRAARTTTTTDTGETVDADREELRRLQDELEARESTAQQENPQIEQQRREESITQREPQTAEQDTAVSDQRAQRDPGTGIGGGPISDTQQSTDPTTTTMDSVLDTADAQLDTVVSDLQVDADQTVEQALQTGENVLRQQATRLRASARERLSTVPGDRRADPDVPAAEEPAGNILSRFREGFERGLAGARPRDIGESDEVFGFPTEVPERIELEGDPTVESDDVSIEVPEETRTGLPLAGAELEEIGTAQQRGAEEFSQNVASTIVPLALQQQPGVVPGTTGPAGGESVVTDPAIQTVSGAIGGLASIPGSLLVLGEESGEAAQALEGGEASPREVSESVGVTAGGTVRGAVENPFRALGEVGGGFVVGGAASRVVRGAPGRVRAARIRSRGGRVVDIEDVSDPPRRISGELPAFSRKAEADPDIAQTEFLEQARATDIAGDEPVAFHVRDPADVQRFGGFGDEFEAPSGKENLGFFQSADVSPLRIRGAGESDAQYTLGIPRPRIRTSRILAERDIDVEVGRGRTEAETGRFLESEASRQKSFIRTDVEGGPTPEQEVIAPPGSQFVEEGGMFGVRVGSDVIPGRLTRRRTDVDAGDVRRADDDGDVLTQREIGEETAQAVRESLRRRDQPDRVTPIVGDTPSSRFRADDNGRDGRTTTDSDSRRRRRADGERTGPSPTGDRRVFDDGDRTGPGPTGDRFTPGPTSTPPPAPTERPPPPPSSERVPPPPPSESTPPPPPDFPFIPGGQQPSRRPEPEVRQARREDDEEEQLPAGQQFRNPIQSALGGLFGAVATATTRDDAEMDGQLDDDDPFGVFL